MTSHLYRMAGEKPWWLNDLSSLISRSMQLIGKNAFTSWISKNMVQVSDAIWLARTGKKQYSGGSSSEGTTTSSSDVDKMVVERGILVLMDSKVTGHVSNTAYFRADPTRSNEGYVRLAPDNEDKLAHETYGNFGEVMETTDDGKFLSCDKFVDFISGLSLAPENCPDPMYRHGPCLTVDHGNIHGYAPAKAPGETIEADVAFALELQEWPPSAREWFAREREHNWPQQETIDKISGHKCHAVPVGDPTSEFPALEWRLSFLLGERELIWSFNDTQLLCYVILKYLRKTYIEPLVPDQINSYHLKTIIFWLSEKNGVDGWTEDKLITCIDNCLAYLYSCIESKSLQHYFNKRNNLFRHKLADPTSRGAVMERITEIRRDLPTSILDGGLSGNCRIHKQWLILGRNIELLLKYSSESEELGVLFPFCKTANNTRRRYQAILNTCANITDCLDTLPILQRLSEDFEIHVPSDADPVYIAHIKHYLDIRIAIALLTHQAHEGKPTLQTQILACQNKFEEAKNFNTVSGNLYAATYYIYEEKYRLCKDVLSNMFIPMNSYMYIGYCSSKPGLTAGQEGTQIEQTTDVLMTGEEDEVFSPVFDILFSADDLIFVPYPLKFECALFPGYGERYFFIHPCFYEHVLLFFVGYFDGNPELAKTSLFHMEEIIRESGFTFHRYRALNILGFCHSLAGDLSRGIMFFVQSLGDSKLLPNVTNAAGYHLAILSYGVYCGVTSNWTETLYRRTV